MIYLGLSKMGVNFFLNALILVISFPFDEGRLDVIAVIPKRPNNSIQFRRVPTHFPTLIDRSAIERRLLVVETSSQARNTFLMIFRIHPVRMHTSDVTNVAAVDVDVLVHRDAQKDFRIIDLLDFPIRTDSDTCVVVLNT